jgi:hypothetical protein
MTTHCPNALWIGSDPYLSVGDVGFLVECQHNLQGWTRYSLQDVPACTNMGHAEQLHGWCGTTNDVAVYARGVAKVERLAKNGRVRVQRLFGADRAAALEELGYPELAEA